MSFSRCSGRVRKATPEMRLFVEQIAGHNSEAHSKLIRNLRRAMLEELTDRQRQIMMMYHADELNMRQIADVLSIHPSTVSRTLKRAENNLRRCLRYGAADYLVDMYND